MSYGKAAKTYMVPKTTIVDHVTGKSQIGKKAGRKSTIPIQVENSIVEKILAAAERGFGVTKKQLIIKVARLAKLKGITFKNGVPGDDWWRAFKYRHPEIVIRRPEQLSTTRSRMLNKAVVQKYFKDLHIIIKQNKLAPSDIWNADETCKQFSHNPAAVLARRGVKSLPGRTSTSRQSITILACVNASGDKMPPMCIVKGKTPRCVESFATIDAPPETIWTYQEKAWMCDLLGELWFKSVFLQNCGPRRPQLLVLDSHSSHEVLGLLEAAISENILIMALPPHTSHHLQPLDKAVFGPFSKAYGRACSEFMTNHPNHEINKSTWPRIFKSAWEASVTPDNIKSGFRATGIWPMNVSALPDYVYLPSEAFDLPIENRQQTSVPSSSQPNLSLTLLAETAVSLTTTDLVEDHDSSTKHGDELGTPDDLIPDDMASLDAQIPPADVGALLDALGNGALELSGTSDANNNASTWNWTAEIDDIFSIPKSTPKMHKSRSSNSITSHRLLTSEEIPNVTYNLF
ncbi:uncharacterized protein LOC134228881 [Saccostrea cucullata]|uniref:uncharacterized protein LOC134228881 n=1 Tax=Saccostrea cuccullata TaxID=36930 RepID=UPI002ED67D03